MTRTQNKTEELRKIKDEIIDLKESPLYEIRVKNKVFPVIGEGNHDAEIMFIGEAPGRNEAETGRPFCGTAGRILDELLMSVGIERKSVYITNIVKDRPPMNRDPLPDEIAMYAPFLDCQVQIIQPKVIATLGRFSMDYIMRHYGLSDMVRPISQIHGSEFETELEYGKVTVIPFYHPAVAVYDASQKETLKNDFQILKNFLRSGTS